MAISIHFDKQTLNDLDQAVEHTGKNRSSIVIEAVQSWLARRQDCDWHRFVHDHGGICPDLEHLGSFRGDLLPGNDDPMGLDD